MRTLTASLLSKYKLIHSSKASIYTYLHLFRVHFFIMRVYTERFFYDTFRHRGATRYDGHYNISSAPRRLSKGPRMCSPFQKD